MCGIAGILTSRSDLDLEKPLQQMKAALRHRGPDGEGLEMVRLPSGIQIGPGTYPTFDPGFIRGGPTTDVG